jgi:hypothetical protein
MSRRSVATGVPATRLSSPKSGHERAIGCGLKPNLERLGCGFPAVATVGMGYFAATGWRGRHPLPVGLLFNNAHSR